MWRTWPSESAKTVAQKPAGRVSPPLSPAHAAGAATAPFAVESAAAGLSPFAQATAKSAVHTASERVKQVVYGCMT